MGVLSAVVYKLELPALLILSVTLTTVLLTKILLSYLRCRLCHVSTLAMLYGLLVGVCFLYYSEEVRENRNQAWNTTDESGNKTTDISLNLNKTLEFYTENYEVLSSNYSTRPTTATMSPPGNTSVIKHYGYYTMFKDYFASAISITDIGDKFSSLRKKLVFQPDVFFDIFLPPIIFNAGYNINRSMFFSTLPRSASFAFFGSLVATITTSVTVYSLSLLLPSLNRIITLKSCLYFGSLISATDPGTVLSVFDHLNVDATLYYLILGESVLNDAVTVALTAAIDDISSATSITTILVIKKIGLFFTVFPLSIIIGAVIGFLAALVTKIKFVKKPSILESCLLVSMSYNSYYLAEYFNLSGIVSILFCGIIQSQYAQNNLSRHSKVTVASFWKVSNFVFENITFIYMCLSMVLFSTHRLNLYFVFVSFVGIALGRFCNIYGISYCINCFSLLGISSKFEHMMYFCGLRGAVAYAIAMRRTSSDMDQIILTTTCVIVVATSLVCGEGAALLLKYLEIPQNESSNARESTEPNNQFPPGLERVYPTVIYSTSLSSNRDTS